MADKKQSPAQEVQEELEEIANGVYMKKADIEKQRAHNAAHPRPIENGCRPQEETDPEIINADLIAKIDEITIMQDKGYNPDRIAAVYKSAADDARRISSITGNEKYTQLAEQLEQGAVISPLMEQTAEPDPHHYIFTATGKEFVLPEQLEEYKKDNPIGAAAFEEEQAAAAQEVQHITIDIPPVDPKLDPNSPDFDLDAWKAAFDDNGGIAAARERMEQAMQHLVETITTESKPLISPELVDAMQNRTAENIGQMITNIANSITNFINSDTYKAIKEAVQHLGEWYAENEETISAAADAAEEMRPLIPFLQEELEAAKQDPQYKDITIPELLAMGVDEDGNPTESKWQQIIERAKQRKADFEAAQEIAEQAEAIQKLTDDLPMLQSIVPKSHTMPNNALMNALQNGVKHKDGTPATTIINAGEFDLPVLPENKRRSEITSYTMVSYDENRTGITLTGAKLTEYERQVSDAFITLWLYGDESKIMTSDMIYRAMTGTTGKAPAGQKGAITRVMKKFEGLRITVDATEEMQRRGIHDANGKPIKKVWFDEFYLNTRRLNVKMNGETVTAWQILSKPVILSYSEMTGQLLTVPAKLLDIKEVSKTGLATTVSVPNTAERIAIKGYLLRAIQVMKNKKRNKLEWSNIIAFEKLFKETETETDNRTQRKRNMDFIFNCLQYWKTLNHIAGYKKRTGAKNAITGVEIIL